MDNWNEFITEVASILEARENYQRKLGKIASEIGSKYGMGGLASFVDELKEQGVSVSLSTMRNYAWVWNRVGTLELPEDLSYRALQHIASSSSPEGWAKKIMETGMSSAEVCKLIREEKGLPAKSKICQNCGAPIK